MDRRMIARELVLIAQDLVAQGWPSKVEKGALREGMGLDPNIPLEDQASPSDVASFFKKADKSGRGMVMFAVNSNQDSKFWKKVGDMIGG